MRWTGRAHHPILPCTLLCSLTCSPTRTVHCRLQTPGSHARRWGQLLRFDAGLLANIKAMGEDLTEFGVDELASCHIDPSSISWQPRRQG